MKKFKSMFSKNKRKDNEDVGFDGVNTNYKIREKRRYVLSKKRDEFSAWAIAQNIIGHQRQMGH